MYIIHLPHLEQNVTRHMDQLYAYKVDESGEQETNTFKHIVPESTSTLTSEDQAGSGGTTPLHLAHVNSPTTQCAEEDDDLATQQAPESAEPETPPRAAHARAQADDAEFATPPEADALPQTTSPRHVDITQSPHPRRFRPKVNYKQFF